MNLLNLGKHLPAPVILSEVSASRTRSMYAAEGSLSCRRDESRVKEFSRRIRLRTIRLRTIIGKEVFAKIRANPWPALSHSHCDLCRSSHQQAGFPCCGNSDLLHGLGTVPTKSYSVLFPFSAEDR